MFHSAVSNQWGENAASSQTAIWRFIVLRIKHEDIMRQEYILSHAGDETRGLDW
jgi:hypothetical protein